jgi:DNA-binding MarR family transcriptional regulator
MARTIPAHARLSPQQLATWRLFLRVHAQLTRRLEFDLVQEHDLPLAWYDVLVQLQEAEGHRLRMTELADKVLISRSGLTRLVDRMVAARLIRREQASDDARGFFAVLTEEGFEKLREASRTHMRGIRKYAIGYLDEDDLDTLARLLMKMDPSLREQEAVTADQLKARLIGQSTRTSVEQSVEQP